MSMISDFFEALRFLTVLPLPGAHKKGNLARAMFFFPLVGLLIAGVSLLMAKGLFSSFPYRLQALALVTLPILLTGGLHVDGFADFCDGFFGGKKPEEILRIMREPQIGTWGAVGVSLLLFWKWELLAALPARQGVFILALTTGRWAQVALAYFLPYANPQGGLGEAVAKKVKVRELVGASAFLFLVLIFFKAQGIFCFLALLALLAGMGFFFYRRVGGITGDLLGATSEASEVFILLFFTGTTYGSFK